jgi:ABC-type phosphate transport system substrate-binding protein
LLVVLGGVMGGRYKSLLIASGISIAMFSSSIFADLVVIMNQKNSDIVLNKSDISKIFLGKKKKFPNNQLAMPIDLMDAEIKNNFYFNISNKSESQLKSYWARMIFTGKQSPPDIIDNANDVIDLVSNNPNVIGYVEQDDLNKYIQATGGGDNDKVYVVYTVAE